ncbi:MAG: hypothetical protein M9962_06315, partial [Oligoflexia bacterium]|nr:hypothetical protein [Oligoflexia bacterium]
FSILDEVDKPTLYLQDGSVVLEPKNSLGITYDGQNTVYFKAADDAKIQIVSKNTYHYIYCHQGAGELDTGNLTAEELPKIYLVNKNCLIKVQGSLLQPRLSLGGSFHSLNAYTMTDSLREKSKVEKTVIDQLSQDLNHLAPPITISSKVSGENYQVIWQKDSLENLVCDLELKDKIQPTFKPAATLKIEKPAGSFLLSKAFVNQSVFLKCKDNSNHNTYSNLLIFE